MNPSMLFSMNMQAYMANSTMCDLNLLPFYKMIMQITFDIFCNCFFMYFSKGPTQLQISQYNWLDLCCNCDKFRLLLLSNSAAFILPQVLILRLFFDRLLHISPTKLCSSRNPACDSDRLFFVMTIKISVTSRKSSLTTLLC